ncbi:MAG: hypothetical protein MJZ20_11265 [Bacteroidaceae bacterium]|nr:hypothetical protein [Bacteroidaceae bacterium]
MQELKLVLYKYTTLWSRTTKLSETPLREELKNAGTENAGTELKKLK